MFEDNVACTLISSNFQRGVLLVTCKTYTQYQNFHEVTHPVIQYKLNLLRDETTGHKMFNELLERNCTFVGLRGNT